MKRSPPPAGGAPRGGARADRITALSPTVLLLVFYGRLDEEKGRAAAATLGRLLAAGAGPFHTFWDLDQISGYHSEARIALTRVLLEHRAKVASVEAFTRSRITQMGIAVGNIALGGLVRTHEKRDEFDRLMARRVAERGAASGEP